VRFGYHGGTATNYNRIPTRTLATLQSWIRTGNYIDDDDEGSAFAMAVLMNDLAAAVARADQANLAALPAILDWLEHHAPRLAWGSAAALGAWPRIARVYAAGSRRA
jgi:hypothetical protein